MMRILTMVLMVLGLAAVAHAGQEAPRRSAPAAKASASGPVNLNTATVAQLESLPGIGKSVAERILEYRDKVGSAILAAPGVRDRTLSIERRHV